MKGIAGCALVLAVPWRTNDVARRRVRAFAGGA
jgi:hypothetical protein